MNVRKTLVLMGIVTFGQGAWATAQVTDEERFQLGSLAFNVGLGLLSGQAQEKVYDTYDGKKISQLNWDIKQSTTLHLGLTYDPLEWLSLDLGGWTRVAGGNSHMKDYDWEGDEGDGWSDYSTHPDTRLNKAWQAEVSATAWALKRDDLALGVTVGYQRSQLGWESRGGRYTYSSEGGYRDQTGAFLEDKKVIGYQQTNDTPYIGLVGRYTLREWILESRFKYSQWVKARDFDNHYLRYTTFAGNHGNKGQMQSLAVALTYRVAPEFSIRAGIDYQVYGEAKGSTLIKNESSGQSFHDGGNSSSQASRTLLSNIALAYQF